MSRSDLFESLEARRLLASVALTVVDSTSSILAGHMFSAHALSSTFDNDAQRLNARFEWDFGDTNNTNHSASGVDYDDNKLVGWNAAHIYETAGTYTVGLKMILENGVTHSTSTTVTVGTDASASRPVWYIDDSISVDGTGSSSSSPVRWNTFKSLVSNNFTNKKILFARGTSVALGNGFDVGNGVSNIYFGAYGSGDRPKMVFTGSSPNGKSIISVAGEHSVSFNDLEFVGVQSYDNTGLAAISAEGSKRIAVNRCRFTDIGEAVKAKTGAGNPAPTASSILVQDNVAGTTSGIASEQDDIQANFVYLQARNAVIIGNYITNSTDEHILRSVGSFRVLIAHNRFENIHSDSGDDGKAAINIQAGSSGDSWAGYHYVTGNHLKGPVGVGPLGKADGTPGEFTRYAVFDGNRVIGQMRVEHGAQKIVLRNNLVRLASNSEANGNSQDQRSGIFVDGYFGSFTDSNGTKVYNRSTSEVYVLHNTISMDSTTDNVDFSGIETVAPSGTGIVKHTLVGNIVSRNNTAFSNAKALRVNGTASNNFTLIGDNIFFNNTNPVIANSTNYTSSTWNTYLSGQGLLSALGGDVFGNPLGVVVSNPYTENPLPNATANIVAAQNGAYLDLRGYSRTGTTVTAGALSYGQPNAGAIGMVTASDGTLHVFWYDTVTTTLKYQSRSSAGVWGSVTTIDSTAFNGVELSAAIDGLDRPAVAYRDGTNTDLKFARLESGSWVIATAQGAGRNAGLGPSLAFDVSNRPQISYYDSTASSLRFTHRDGSGVWQMVELDNATSADTGRTSSLRQHPNGGFAVAYEDRTNGNVLYMEQTGSGSAWPTSSTLAAASSGVRSISLDISGNSSNPRPGIAYYDFQNTDLRFARRGSGGTWSNVFVAGTSSDQGLLASLKYGGDGDDPKIVFYSTTGKSIREASATVTSDVLGSFSASDIYSRAGKGLAVAWSGTSLAAVGYADDYDSLIVA